MDYHQPSIVQIGDRLYLLVEDWTFTWNYTEVVESCINVPAGFVYDGASIPRMFWRIFGVTPDGVHRAAAIVHDWIYTFDGDVPSGSITRSVLQPDCTYKKLDTIDKWTQKDCDKFFKKMLLDTPLPRWKVQTMYIAVRLFGWSKWKN